jgi:[acyl-carrier-protein] S-malonyltransferase
MGKDLYQTYPAAKTVFDRAAALLDFDLLHACFEGPEEKLTQTRYAQPAIFVTSMAALAVLQEHAKHKELNPRFAAGLSLGEATALCAAGAFAFDDGVRFVRARGQFMDEAAHEKPSMMAAVLGMGLADVEKVCELSGAEVGNLNAPGQIVISGYRADVEKAMELLREKGARKVIPLDVSGGFHSRCMDSASSRIEKALEGMAIREPRIPVVSNLTARIEVQPHEIKSNLVRQMNHRTLWEDSMRFLIGQGVRTFVELAPGKVLKGLLKKIDPAVETISVGTLEDFHAIEG